MNATCVPRFESIFHPLLHLCVCADYSFLPRVHLHIWHHQREWQNDAEPSANTDTIPVITCLYDVIEECHDVTSHSNICAHIIMAFLEEFLNSGQPPDHILSAVCRRRQTCSHDTDPLPGDVQPGTLPPDSPIWCLLGPELLLICLCKIWY